MHTLQPIISDIHSSTLDTNGLYFSLKSFNSYGSATGVWQLEPEVFTMTRAGQHHSVPQGCPEVHKHCHLTQHSLDTSKCAQWCQCHSTTPQTQWYDLGGWSNMTSTQSLTHQAIHWTDRWVRVGGAWQRWKVNKQTTASESLAKAVKLVFFWL